MTRRRRCSFPPALAVASLLALLLLPAAARAAELDRFFGTYVGRAEEGGTDGPGELRDIDLVIGPEGEDGLVVRWTNVTLVDGRRDVPGVRRRTDEVSLMPAEGGRPGLYLARTPYDPFTKRERPDAVAGDPVRWATVEGDALRTYSLVVLDDGRYELQVYARTLTPEGVALDWRRIVDGETVRRMTGRTVRAD